MSQGCTGVVVCARALVLIMGRPCLVGTNLLATKACDVMPGPHPEKKRQHIPMIFNVFSFIKNIIHLILFIINHLFTIHRLLKKNTLHNKSYSICSPKLNIPLLVRAVCMYMYSSIQIQLYGKLIKELVLCWKIHTKFYVEEITVLTLPWGDPAKSFSRVST